MKSSTRYYPDEKEFPWWTPPVSGNPRPQSSHLPQNPTIKFKDLEPKTHFTKIYLLSFTFRVELAEKEGEYRLFGITQKITWER